MKPFNLREHKETITSTNTLITNPLVNQKKPIMSNKAKLYTEEQVRKALLIGMNIGYSNNFNLKKLEQETDKAMIHLTPIELPSDEEIEKHSHLYGIGFPLIKIGAKWVIEQIKNKQQ